MSQDDQEKEEIKYEDYYPFRVRYEVEEDNEDYDQEENKDEDSNETINYDICNEGEKWLFHIPRPKLPSEKKEVCISTLMYWFYFYITTKCCAAKN